MESRDNYWHAEGGLTMKICEEERKTKLARKRRQRNTRLRQHLSGQYLQNDD